MDITRKLEDKILNLDKIMKLNQSDKDYILHLFDKLTNCFNGENGISISLPGSGDIRFDYITSDLIYHTLIEYEYLVTRRDKRLNDVLDKQ